MSNNQNNASRSLRVKEQLIRARRNTIAHALEVKNYKLANIIAKSLAQSHPNDFRAHVLLAEVMQAQGKLQETIDAYNEALSLMDLDKVPDILAIYHYEVADCYIALGDHDSARHHLDHVFDIISDYPSTIGDYEKLLHAYNEIDDNANVVRVSESALNKFKNQEEYRKKLDAFTCARAMYSLGLPNVDNVDLSRHFKQAVEIQPNYAGLRLQYALFLLSINRTGDAIQEADQALKLRPDDNKLKIDVANVHTHAGSLNKAEEIFEAIEDSNSNSAYYFYIRHFLYMRKGQLYHAESCLNSALDQARTSNTTDLYKKIQDRLEKVGAIIESGYTADHADKYADLFTFDGDPEETGEFPWDTPEFD